MSDYATTEEGTGPVGGLDEFGFESNDSYDSFAPAERRDVAAEANSFYDTYREDLADLGQFDRGKAVEHAQAIFAEHAREYPGQEGDVWAAALLVGADRARIDEDEASRAEGRQHAANILNTYERELGRGFDRAAVVARAEELYMAGERGREGAVLALRRAAEEAVRPTDRAENEMDVGKRWGSVGVALQALESPTPPHRPLVSQGGTEVDLAQRHAMLRKDR